MNRTVKRLLFTPRKHPIYGASWNKGESPALTRTDSSSGMVSGVAVGSAFSRNDFDGVSLFSEIHDVIDTYGNVFRRIPKCYIKKTDGEGLMWPQVSKTQYPGFYRPACFWDFTNNRELPYIDVGKYKATKDGANKLESKPNLYPLVLDHIVNFRTFAQNNNTGGLLGYQQLDVHVVDLLRTLIFIEFATLNTQTVMQGYTTGQYSAAHVATDAENAANRIIVANAHGALYRVGQTISIGSALGNNSVFYGRTITAIDVDTPEAGKTAVTFDGAAVNIAVNNILYNTGWKNGFSSAIAASSGSIGSNSDGKYPCVYRGIESIFGDIYQWVDGVNIDGGVAWVTATLYPVGSIVVGTTAGTTYRCTSQHTSAAATQPTTGADWATVWELHPHRRAWVCANADNYASNVFAAPYEQLGYINHNANGFPITMGYDANYPYANFPTSVGGSDSTYYSDQYYQATGEKVVLFGGYWGLGAFSGPSLWNLSGLSATTGVFFGGRLCRKCL